MQKWADTQRLIPSERENVKISAKDQQLYQTSKQPLINIKKINSPISLRPRSQRDL
jgi:hypothetical protein